MPPWTLVLAALLPGCERVQVTAVDVVDVEVRPATASLVVGSTARLEAVIRDGQGNVLDGRALSWTSSDERVATVDSDGTVRGMGPGSAVISVRAEGVTGSGSVEVLPGPGIGLDRSEVGFAAPEGGRDPPDETVSISNTGSGQLTGLAADVEYPDGQPSGWLFASLARTRAPTTLTLRASTGSLTEGTYTALVRIRGGDASATLTVTFAVGDPEPRIGLGRTDVEMLALRGGAAPDPVSIQVTNVGGQSLSGLSASVDYRVGESGWLSADLNRSTAPATLRLRAVPDGLAAATHVATVRVSSPVAVNSPREITVALVVTEPAPSIALDPDTVRLQATEGGAAPDAARVAITNDGGGTLESLSTSISWGGGPEGWLDAELDRRRAPATLTLQASIEGLPEGTYRATVLVSAPGADDSPAALAVILRVGAPENQVPEAGFTSECTLLLCTFRDASEDPDGDVASWQWDFGDGSSSNRRNPEHAYLLPGTYTVTLTVTDDDGATDAVSRDVTVVAPENDPPEAAFEVSCQELECDFQDRSEDEDGSIVEREWDFGDGTTSQARNPEHEYEDEGTYTVTLTVTDDDGDTDSASRELTVASANTPPTAAFDVKCDDDDLECDFQDRSEDEDGSIVEWEWDFGDGETSNDQDPEHEYEDEGTYTVTLTVTDDEGATDTAERSVTVEEDDDDGAPSISLSAEGFKDEGLHHVRLQWSGAAGDRVDVERDGVRVDRVANDGNHVDDTGGRGQATYAYRICEAGQDRCSNREVVGFD